MTEMDGWRQGCICVCLRARGVQPQRKKKKKTGEKKMIFNSFLLECRVLSYIHMNCRKHSSVLIYFHYIQIGRRETLFFLCRLSRERLLVLVTNTYAALFQADITQKPRKRQRQHIQPNYLSV